MDTAWPGVTFPMVRRIGLTIGLVLGALSTGFVSASATPYMSHHLVEAAGFSPLNETRNSDGTVTDTWAKGLARVTVSGLPGLDVAILPNGVSVTASTDKSRAPSQIVAAYAAAKRSPANDLNAVGGVANGASAPSLIRSAASIYNSWCTSVTSADGHVYTQACDLQFLDVNRGNGDWYLADEAQASGRSNDTSFWFPDRLTSVGEYLSYGVNNTIVQWSPGVTQYEPSSCATATVGYTSSQTGVNFSISKSICASYFGPWNQTLRAFGTAWHGREPQANWYEGTISVDEDHNPWNASPNPTLVVSETW